MILVSDFSSRTILSFVVCLVLGAVLPNDRHCVPPLSSTFSLFGHNREVRFLFFFSTFIHYFAVLIFCFKLNLLNRFKSGSVYAAPIQM